MEKSEQTYRFFNWACKNIILAFLLDAELEINKVKEVCISDTCIMQQN
jgi:hypothetical protein